MQILTLRTIEIINFSFLYHKNIINKTILKNVNCDYNTSVKIIEHNSFLMINHIVYVCS